MAEGKAKVFYLTYERYESLKNSQNPDEHIDANSFYVVSETSQLGSNMLSLYLGEAKQCDLLDITQDVNDPENPIDYVNFINNDNIPESYKIPDKLLFYKQGTYGVDEHYSMLMYYVPEGEDRQQGRFIQVGDSSSIKPDNITILLNQATNEIYGVGANVEGKEYVSGSTTVTAGTGASIYNDYENNKTTGNYSNVFGTNNTDFGYECDIVSGKNHVIKYSSGGSNSISGVNTSINAGNVYSNSISGSGHSITGSDIEGNNISGYSHSISGNSFQDNTLSGYNITMTSNGSLIYGNIIAGTDISIQNGNCSVQKNAIFGTSQSIQLYTSSDASSNLIFGSDVTVSTPASIFDYNIVGCYRHSISRGLQCSAVFGTTNTIQGDPTNPVHNCFIGGGNHIISSYISSNDTIFGMSNELKGSGSSYQNTIVGVGNEVTVSSSSCGNFIGGRSNTITLNLDASFIYGYELTYTNSSSAIGRVLLGYRNDSNVTDSLFTYAYGSDLIRLSQNGLLQICGLQGDVVTATGNNLNTEIRTLTSIAADNASYSSSYLPFNGKETILSSTYTVSSITITSLTNMNYNNGRGDSNTTTSDDYNSVIVFKKGSGISTAEDIMTNFTANDSTKIYLLNPDIDISTFDILHVMLFNDGFHICAIVAGYEEEASS